MKTYCFILLNAVFVLESACQPEITSEIISVTYIANTGIMIESGDTKIMIDALHDPYLDQYQHTPPEVVQQMLNGSAPFNEIDALLVTHVHGDHFDPKLTDAFLKNNSSAKLIAAKQVCDSLQTKTSQLHCLEPEKDSKMIQVGNMQIMIFPLQHTYPTRNHWVQNIAFLIKIDGKSLLVLGDALATEANYNKIEKMTGGSVDVALFPVWYYMADEKSWIKNKFNARQHIAIHLSLEGVAKVERQARAVFPDIIFFTKDQQKYLLK